MKRIIVLTCLVFVFYSVCSGQKMLKQLTMDDGLSEIKCFDIFQDSQGYIWIGTSAGANKYDGKDVIKFDRSNGLMSDHIYSFHEDSQQRIWVNNMNGEPLYIKDNKVHNRLTDPYLEDIKSIDYFRSLVEDNNNRIIFGKVEGVLTILDQDSVFTIEMPELRDSVIFDFHAAFSHNKEILVALSSYIKSLDCETFEPNWTFPIQDKGAFLRKVKHKDKLYLFGLHDAHVFDITTRKLKKLRRNDGGPPIYDCRVLYDEVLLSTEKGASIVNDSVINKYSIHPLIDSIAISALHEDFDGNLWIATKHNGVFSLYNSDVEKSNYAKYCNIIYMNDFAEDSLFIAQEDWSISFFRNGQQKWKKQLNKKVENKFNNIFYKDGELWIVDKYNIHMNVLGDYKTFSTYSRKVYFDEEDNRYYWIGTKGMSILEDLDLIFDYSEMKGVIDCHPDKITDFFVQNPHDFQLDSDNNIWVGSEEGLHHIVQDKINLITNPLLNGSIVALELKDDHLIGINYGNGLFRYNPKTEKVQTLSRKDGLPSNYITHMDIKGNDLWITHATGICLVRCDDNGLSLIKNFGKEHGVPSGRIRVIKVVDDVCHFVVNEKAYSLKPKLEINDTLEILMDTNELSYFTNESKSVNFDCINFTFADKVKYQYRLMPLDSEWKEASMEKVDLEYIPAGDYDLEVRAQHPLNLTSPIKRKPIHISERWYNEIYFRCMVLFIFGFFVFFLIRIKALSFNTANFKHWIGNKIKKYFVKEEQSSFNLKDIHGVVHLLKIHEIKFIKSSGNYLEYHTDRKKYVSRMTMSTAVDKFRLWTDLQRVHRSYMVNFKMIDAIHNRMLKVGESDIPFTDRYRDVIEQKLQL